MWNTVTRNPFKTCLRMDKKQFIRLTKFVAQTQTHITYAFAVRCAHQNDRNAAKLPTILIRIAIKNSLKPVENGIVFRTNNWMLYEQQAQSFHLKFQSYRILSDNLPLPSNWQTIRVNFGRSQIGIFSIIFFCFTIGISSTSRTHIDSHLEHPRY